jgi:ABC-2 type transport system ATP-binding protein
MIMLETKALTRRFGAFTAVDELSLTVETGEVFGLLGSNGAGTTTTITMLTTKLPPSLGAALVGGFDIVRHATDVRRIIGNVPQMPSADGSLTGCENLLTFAKLYDIPHSERGKRVRDALAFMGLTEAADKLVHGYSGGMIGRLEIIQSMLHRPRVLFPDEPTAGLDPLARNSVWGHIGQPLTMPLFFASGAIYPSGCPALVYDRRRIQHIWVWPGCRDPGRGRGRLGGDRRAGLPARRPVNVTRHGYR